MLGWLRQKSRNLAADIQRGELDRFVESVRGFDAPEVGALVFGAALAADTLRRRWAVDLWRPFEALAINGDLPRDLNATIREMQDEGALPQAASVMVWLHTMRAANAIELRAAAKGLWRELHRGYDEAGGLVRYETPGDAIVAVRTARLPDGFDWRA